MSDKSARQEFGLTKQEIIAASRKTADGGFVLWTGSWELFDLPPGTYTVELTALDQEGKVVTSRSEKLLHGNSVPRK